MINRGWECPKCDAVMSPSQKCCMYCKPKNKRGNRSVGQEIEEGIKEIEAWKEGEKELKTTTVSFTTSEAKQDIQLINEHETSKLINKSVFWLRRSRWAGNGIPYRKLGASVRYDLNDVLRWINQHQLQESTSKEKLNDA